MQTPGLQSHGVSLILIRSTVIAFQYHSQKWEKNHYSLNGVDVKIVSQHSIASCTFILQRVHMLEHTIIEYTPPYHTDSKSGACLSLEERPHRVLLAFPGSHSVPSAQGVC